MHVEVDLNEYESIKVPWDNHPLGGGHAMKGWKGCKLFEWYSKNDDRDEQLENYFGAILECCKREGKNHDTEILMKYTSNFTRRGKN